MNFRLVDGLWGKELRDAMDVDSSALRIVCPFVKLGALTRLLADRSPGAIQVITRFNLNDFAAGVSDLSALQAVLSSGGRVRGVRSLHAKLYLFGSSRAIATSANLTQSALDRNHEFGFVSEDAAIVAACSAYFDRLWERGGDDLAVTQIDAWNNEVIHHLATGTPPGRPVDLGDFGADAGLPPTPPTPLPSAAEPWQAFVKFLGRSGDRVPSSTTILDEVTRSGCHWAVAYPESKRPTGVKDGAAIFISRLTRDPNDILIFGRATALRYLPDRDDATPDDIARRPWKANWPRYIRVHHAEFVAGVLSNGVSLNELMDRLGADAFAPTQRNAAQGKGNVDPRKAYSQQAAVELSPQGLSWMNDRLDLALVTHGKVPAEELSKLDWPTMP